jgi:hypothetical protein
VGEQPARRSPGATRGPSAAATIINGMRPRKIGQALGIGVRVAGRIAGQRIAASTAAAGSAPASGQRFAGAQAVPQAAPRVGNSAAIGHAAGQAGRTVSQGVGGFIRPFRRVGGILWFEVTGVLFLLPVLVFGPALWHAIESYSHTSDHRTLWTAGIIVGVFLYLSISAFWRAHRRSSAS